VCVSILSPLRVAAPRFCRNETNTLLYSHSSTDEAKDTVHVNSADSVAVPRTERSRWLHDHSHAVPLTERSRWLHDHSQAVPRTERSRWLHDHSHAVPLTERSRWLHDHSHAVPKLTISAISATCTVNSFTDTHRLTQFLLPTVGQ